LHAALDCIASNGSAERRQRTIIGRPKFIGVALAAKNLVR
jgi:hypothetical protein